MPHASGVDSSGSTGKALLAAAISAYGKRSRPMTEARALVADVDGPEGIGDILVSAYQAEFIKAVDEYVGSDGTKKPESLPLPSAKLKPAVGKGMKGIKTLAKKLNADAATVTSPAKALKGGDTEGFLSGVEKSPEVMTLLQKMNDYLFRELDITYVLVTHIKGNEADWKAGKKNHLCRRARQCPDRQAALFRGGRRGARLRADPLRLPADDDVKPAVQGNQRRGRIAAPGGGGKTHQEEKENRRRAAAAA